MGHPSTAAPWRNWSRTASATPQRVVHPADQDELAETVRKGVDDGLQVRAVGAGHSFTPVAASDGVHLHLDRLNAFERVEPQSDGTTHVTVGAGIRLAALNAELAALGLGMRNLGDIDKQSIAGAISTGTHGTGARLGGLATQIVGARIVTAKGEVVETCPETNPEVFELARLGLGSVGVLSAVTVETVPAFRLEAVEEPWHLDRVLERLEGPDGLIEGNDHFEFYWFPHTRRALTKRNNRVPDDVERPLNRVRGWIDDELLSNALFAATNTVATHRPADDGRDQQPGGPRAQLAPVRRARPRRLRVAASCALPRDGVRRPARPARARCSRRSTAGSRRPASACPSRSRCASPPRTTCGCRPRTVGTRPTSPCTSTSDCRSTGYFRAVERIVADVGGRPHWGKMHWLEAARLGELYPRFADAQRVRRQADPDGVFSNPYLAKLFGS